MSDTNGKTHPPSLQRKKTLLPQTLTNIPADVAAKYPFCRRNVSKEMPLEGFNGRLIREMMEIDGSGKDKKRKPIDITELDSPDPIEVLLKKTQNVIRAARGQRKVGSMFVSELWGEKHKQEVIKQSKLDKAHEDVRQAEDQGLKEKLEELEREYEKSKNKFKMLDPARVIEKFKTKGLNDPLLNMHTNDKLGEMDMLPRAMNASCDIYKLEATPKNEKTEIPEIKKGKKKNIKAVSIVLDETESCGTQTKSQNCLDLFYNNTDNGGKARKQAHVSQINRPVKKVNSLMELINDQKLKYQGSKKANGSRLDIKLCFLQKSKTPKHGDHYSTADNTVKSLFNFGPKYKHSFTNSYVEYMSLPEVKKRESAGSLSPRRSSQKVSSISPKACMNV